MIKKKHIKIIIDICMSVLLVFLMAYQVTGDRYHEWIGAAMLLLFLFHNVLNRSWYFHLRKGKWSPFRVLYSFINFAVLAAILITGYSGIVMSKHVFAFLPITGGMATARILHLSGSYWSFVLMSVHLGMHWNMVLGKWKIENKVLRIIRSLVALAVAIYGALCFGRTDIFGNMLLKNEFAVLDYESAGSLVLLHSLCMMATWIFFGHYLLKAVKQITMTTTIKLRKHL